MKGEKDPDFFNDVLDGQLRVLMAKLKGRSLQTYLNMILTAKKQEHDLETMALFKMAAVNLELAQTEIASLRRQLDEAKHKLTKQRRPLF